MAVASGSHTKTVFPVLAFSSLGKGQEEKEIKKTYQVSVNQTFTCNNPVSSLLIFFFF